MTNTFIKHKKSKLCIGDRITILNNMLYKYGVSIFSFPLSRLASTRASSHPFFVSFSLVVAFPISGPKRPLAGCGPGCVAFLSRRRLAPIARCLGASAALLSLTSFPHLPGFRDTHKSYSSLLPTRHRLPHATRTVAQVRIGSEVISAECGVARRRRPTAGAP